MPAPPDDPFDVFGSGSDNDDINDDKEGKQSVSSDRQWQQQQQQQQDDTVLLRDPECGVLTAHAGTEHALLAFVRNNALPIKNGNNTGDNNTKPSIVRVEQILQAVDDFCLTRHWMMHIGPEKATTLQDFLTECLSSQQQQQQQQQQSQQTKNSQHTKDDRAMILVELGTYCGYSAIRMINTILHHQQPSCKKFHLFTVDINPEHVEIARQLVSLAGFEKFVTFILLPFPDQSSKLLSQRIVTAIQEKFPPSVSTATTTPKIDFLFVDHDKDAYLKDLLDLQHAHLLQAGTHVAADNVVFFQLDQYRQYMMQLQEQGVVQTRLVKGCLEYVTGQTQQQEGRQMDLQDGMGTC